MKTLFKKENLKNTILTLVYLIFGVLLCAMPIKMFNFVESALCFVLLVIGIISIIIYSLLSSDDKPLKLLVYGIIGAGLGLCMMLVPKTFGVLLSLIVGYSGVSMIVSGLKMKKAGEKPWITDFVIGVIVSALSITTIVLSLIGASVGRKILAIFFGIILLINGIYSLVNVVKLLKEAKENKKKLLAEASVSGEQTTEIQNEVETKTETNETESVEEKPAEENDKNSEIEEADRKIMSAKRKIIKRK